MRRRSSLSCPAALSRPNAHAPCMFATVSGTWPTVIRNLPCTRGSGAVAQSERFVSVHAFRHAADARPTKSGISRWRRNRQGQRLNRLPKKSSHGPRRLKTLLILRCLRHRSSDAPDTNRYSHTAPGAGISLPSPPTVCSDKPSTKGKEAKQASGRVWTQV
jgi:hypothetical protein